MRKNNKPYRQKALFGWRLLFFLSSAISGFFCLTNTLAKENLEWDVTVTPFNQVFPSLELSQTQRESAKKNSAEIENVIGSGTGLIAIRVHTHQMSQNIRLTIEAPGLSAPSETIATLPQADRDYKLHPQFQWDIAALRDLHSPREAILTLALESEGVLLEKRTLNISLRPLNEALYYVRDGSDKVDLSWIFAAYVNPNDDIVNTILHNVNTNTSNRDFGSYEGDDVNEVYRQVWAVWQAIEAHGVRYSNADPAISRGPHIFSQHVRFLTETWRDKQANCIDGSVLLASVLERVGIHTFLILIPGHAFLGFYTDKAKHNAAYIETTLLGETSLPPLQQRPAFAADFSQKATDTRSLANFTAALATGRARFAKVAKKLDGRHQPDYVLIDIATARAYGIMPIPVSASQKQRDEAKQQVKDITVKAIEDASGARALSHIN